MTNRERLAKLICESMKEQGDSWSFSEIADHLIEHGVIVPTFKEGDLVYAFYNTTEYTSRYFRSDKVKNKRYNRLIHTCSELASAKSIEIREIAYKKSYSTMLGKTVFLTKEEAEQALKGHEGK